MKPRKFEITILDALGRYIFKEEEQGWDERDVLEKVLAKKKHYFIHNYKNLSSIELLKGK